MHEHEIFNAERKPSMEMKNDKENLLAFPRFLNNLLVPVEWASSREIENAERSERRAVLPI
jgi:hypothetical protein